MLWMACLALGRGQSREGRAALHPRSPSPTKRGMGAKHSPSLLPPVIPLPTTPALGLGCAEGSGLVTGLGDSEATAAEREGPGGGKGGLGVEDVR